jgi:C-terminal processing protease CtpA/Prc
MKFAAFLLAGIGLGIGFAWLQADKDPAPESGLALTVEDQAALARRLSELETELALERYERQVLADDLAAIRAAISVEPVVADPATPDPRERIAALANSTDGAEPELIRQRFADGFEGRFQIDESAREQRQIERFIDAGLTAERAQWVVQREEELQMEVLQARYEATQNGASADEVANLSASAMMREELGDADYEKYLEGLGRPTTINVREVLSNSPAQAAGLQSGDQIVGYDGQRIFDMSELNSLTYEGRPGETVAIDVLRDGQPIQLYVERGPIGVSGGGRSTRRRP